MTISYTRSLAPRIKDAVDELSSLIRSAYPDAQFQIRSHPEEASTTLLEAIVDVDDTDEVLDLVFDRMEQMRLDESIPILVVPLQTPNRVAALLEAARARVGTPVATSLT